MKFFVSRLFFKSLLLSPIIWAGVVLSLMLASWVSQKIDDLARNEFAHKVNDAHAAINARLESYKEVLRATNALFSSTAHHVEMGFPHLNGHIH